MIDNQTQQQSMVNISFKKLQKAFCLNQKSKSLLLSRNKTQISKEGSIAQWLRAHREQALLHWLRFYITLCLSLLIWNSSAYHRGCILHCINSIILYAWFCRDLTLHELTKGLRRRLSSASPETIKLMNGLHHIYAST